MKFTALSQGALGASFAAALELARQPPAPGDEGACRADNMASITASGAGALTAMIVAKVNGTPATAQVLIIAAILASVAAQFGYIVASRAALPAPQRVLLIAALVGMSQYAAFGTKP